MIYHLSDPQSSKVDIVLTNPCFVSEKQVAHWRQLEAEGRLAAETFMSSVGERLENLRYLYGNNWKSPTHTLQMPGWSYCGTPIIREPKPAPEFLWNPINYIPACNIPNYPDDEVCQICVDALDQIRDKQGYRPVRERQAAPEECECAGWYLWQHGCKCGKQ
jgi:hypothetical protein